MNKNFSLNFKLVDIIVIVTSLIVGAGLITSTVIYNNTQNHSSRIVEVFHDGEEIKTLREDLNTLTETKTIVLKKDDYDLLGDFTIELDKDKGIRVEEATCPNHTCMNQGWVNIDNLPLVCIPNSVEVKIVSNQSSGSIVI